MTTSDLAGDHPIHLGVHPSEWRNILVCYAVLKSVLLRLKIIRRIVCTAVAVSWLVEVRESPIGLFCLRSIRWVLTNPN